MNKQKAIDKINGWIEYSHFCTAIQAKIKWKKITIEKLEILKISSNWYATGYSNFCLFYFYAMQDLLANSTKDSLIKFNNIFKRHQLS